MKLIQAIVLIGIPGSGKSTYIAKHLLPLLTHPQQIVCPDDIREELTGSASNQSMNTEVWEEAYYRSAKILANYGLVVFDSTNAKRTDRVRLLQHLSDAMGTAGHIQGIYLDTPIDECQKRNARRERKVPTWAIERMHYELLSQPPSHEDGFDELLVI